MVVSIAGRAYIGKGEGVGDKVAFTICGCSIADRAYIGREEGVGDKVAFTICGCFHCR